MMMRMMKKRRRMRIKWGEMMRIKWGEMMMLLQIDMI